jgi:glycosyltransferase involved in cell wall biosynthesis
MQEFGGISRYFASLAGELLGITDVEPCIVAPMYINAYLAQLPSKLVYGQRVANVSRLPLLRRAISAAMCDFVQRRIRPDIVHKTYYHALPSTPPRAVNVLTVYDLIQEKFPQDFPPGNIIAKLKKRAVAKADHIICISEQTRNDLLATYPIPAERVSVTLLGYDPLSSLVSGGTARDFRLRVFGTDTPYLLYVGRRPGYKNFDGLLRAYTASPWLRSGFNLLCFGGGQLTKDELTQLGAFGVADSVRYVGGDDALLAQCYRHAAIFVFPSFYEGFGFPPLEAMSVDCPVACSRSSSIPEVVGDAAAYFDPYDSESIRATLEDVLNSSSRINSLTERGRARRQEFSWRRCAEETVTIYRKIARV